MISTLFISQNSYLIVFGHTSGLIATEPHILMCGNASYLV